MSETVIHKDFKPVEAWSFKFECKDCDTQWKALEKHESPCWMCGHPGVWTQF